MNRCFIGILFILLSLSLHAEEIDNVRVWNRNYEKAYHLDILRLALKLSEPEYGDYTIDSSPPLEQGRVFAELDSSKMVNVVIAGISKERESQHTPIFIPIDKGLLGFRICLVKNSRLSFKGINVLKDFSKRNISLGVGTHWPDKQIYESNGLRVQSTPLYENLFEMLEKNRFDCLPRSISELDMEIQNHPSQSFSAEPDIALVYSNADFIYVSKTHQKLKDRLELGINRAMTTGEFNTLFTRYYGDILLKYNFYNRKLLILENPNLSNRAKSAINKYGIATFLRLNNE